MQSLTMQLGQIASSNFRFGREGRGAVMRLAGRD
jgi:hypothetical protein